MRGARSRSAAGTFGLGLILLGAAVPATAHAQSPPPRPESSVPAQPAPTDRATRPLAIDGQQNDIVVIGRRGEATVAAETELGEDDIARYGADTIAQLLAGASPLIDATGKAPILLVNGKRIGAASGVTGFPPEALERLAILQPQAAARYGYPADQRVVNLVLKAKFTSWDASTGLTLATAGGRDSENISVGRVVIHGSTYWNAQLQLSRDSMLLKSARPLTVHPDPVDLAAHIAGIGGQEIDPALSRNAGRAVTIVDVPRAVLPAPPRLADFAAAANSPVRYSDPDEADALLPGNRSLAFNLGVTHPLGSFSGSLNVNVTTNDSVQRLGYPSPSLVLPAGSRWSPFDSDVVLVPGLSGIAPLTSQQGATTLGVSGTVTGSIAGWNTNLIADYAKSWSDSSFDRGVDLQDAQSRIDAGDSTFNPYAPLARPALVATDRTRSQTGSLDARLIVDRALTTLPAGPLTTNLTIGFNHVSVTSEVTDQGAGTALPGLRRTEINGQASFDVPLLRRGQGVGRAIGELSANATVGLSAIAGQTVQRRLDTVLNWSPATALQLFGGYSVAEEAPDVAQLNAPQIETVVRIYDPIRQEVADPIWITGGNPDLRRGKRTTLTLKGTWRPFHSRSLTLNLGYQRQVANGGATGFPQLTPAIESAFPDRIGRDASGRLIAVDARPISIDRDGTAQLTSGFNLLWSPATSPGPDGKPGIGSDRWQVSLSFNHNWQLESLLVIGPGVPALDRLGGDGGQPRHSFSWQMMAGRRAMGATLDGQWQGPARIRNAGIADGQGDYRYAAMAQVNLGLFLEPGAIFDMAVRHDWAKNTRLSIDVRNIFDSYQRVILADGEIPAGYDRYQLNPLGRTLQLTIRKRF